MKDLARFSGAGTAAQPNNAGAGERAEVRLITIGPDEAGQRIDNFLLRVCKGVPKSHVYQVLRSGQVRVNKGRIAQTYRLLEGDTVLVETDEGILTPTPSRLVDLADYVATLQK